METTRQHIADRLRRDHASPSDIASDLGTSPTVVIDHVRHIARSLRDRDEVLLVAPPTCRDCGFEAFDDPANIPSRCPACKSEAVDEPTFTIEPGGG